MHKAAGVEKPRQNLVDLLYQELKQERAARVQLQQQLWQLTAVHSHKSEPADLAGYAGAASTCACPAAAAAHHQPTVAAACAVLQQQPAEADFAQAANPLHGAYTPVAGRGIQSGRQQLLQQLRQAADTDYWPHAEPVHRHVNQHHHHQQQQQQQHVEHSAQQQHARHPDGLLHSRQQQEQQQHQQLLHLALEAAAPAATPTQPAPEAAAPSAFIHAGFYDLQPAARVTPHLAPTAPAAAAATPLTCLGYSSSQPCWSAPASCISSSHSTVTPSRGLAGGTAAMATVLSPDAAAVLLTAAAVRDSNSLQLLVDSVLISSSDSEQDDHQLYSGMTTSCCCDRPDMVPNLPTTPAQQLWNEQCFNQHRCNSRRYQQQQLDQLQDSGSNSRGSHHTLAANAAAGSNHAAAAADAWSTGASAARATGQVTTADIIPQQGDMQEHSWGDDIGTFCSMFRLDNAYQDTTAGLQKQNTYWRPGQPQQLPGTPAQGASHAHHPNSDSRLLHEQVYRHCPDTTGQQRRQLHHLPGGQAAAVQRQREQPGTARLAGDLKTGNLASSCMASATATGADRSASVACVRCDVLQEKLLETEFERELASAQLSVVVEERDLLALQHRSLVEMVVHQQTGTADIRSPGHHLADVH